MSSRVQSDKAPTEVFMALYEHRNPDGTLALGGRRFYWTEANARKHGLHGDDEVDIPRILRSGRTRTVTISRATIGGFTPCG